jgi:hypothetical protein
VGNNLKVKVVQAAAAKVKKAAKKVEGVKPPTAGWGRRRIWCWRRICWRRSRAASTCWWTACSG